jgi:predicted transcriptional regulator
MKRTQIYLDDEQDARLEKRARASGRTKSALIRDAINRFLAREPAPRELQAALEETAGALPDLEVPDRGEWDRGYA